MLMNLALITAAAVSLLVAPAAEAAFAFRTQRIAGTGTNGSPVGTDRVLFIADEEAGPNYVLGAFEVTVSAIGGTLRFLVPTTGSPDVYGPQDVALRLPPPDFNGGVALNTQTFASLPGATSLATPEPGVGRAGYQAGLVSYNVVSFFTSPQNIAPVVAIPNGLVLASAVVNTGVGVSFVGNLDTDQNAANGFQSFAVGIPEPTTLAAVSGLSAVGLIRRRR